MPALAAPVADERSALREYLALEILEFGLMVAWVFATIYITSLGVTFYIRFLGGRWKSMRVIELEPQVPKMRPTKLGRVAKL